MVATSWSQNTTIRSYGLDYFSGVTSFHGRDWTQYDYTLPSKTDTKPYWTHVAARIIEMYAAGTGVSFFVTLPAPRRLFGPALAQQVCSWSELKRTALLEHTVPWILNV